MWSATTIDVAVNNRKRGGEMATQSDTSPTLRDSTKRSAHGATSRHVLAWPVATALTCIGAIAAFLIFTSEVFEADLAAMDAVGRTWAVALRSPFADGFFRVVTAMAATRVVLTVSLVAAAILWWRGVRRVAIPLALAAMVAPLTTQTIKPVFGRLRPGYVDDGGRSFSFPSGHTTVATAAVLTLAYVLVRERIAPRVAPALAVLFVIAVGASRVYLQEHWVTDVVGGLAMGTAIAAACATVYEIGRFKGSFKGSELLKRVGSRGQSR